MGVPWSLVLLPAVGAAALSTAAALPAVAAVVGRCRGALVRSFTPRIAHRNIALGAAGGISPGSLQQLSGCWAPRQLGT